MNNETNFATKVGRFIGNLFVACIAEMHAAIMIALTVRFIALLF